MLTASVLLGVITAGRFSSGRWPRFLTAGLHRNISLLVLVFLALHVGTTVLDTFVSIPVIASGGAGAVPHFPPAVAAGADAVLAASVFHFGEVSIGEVKSSLSDAGYPVR